jgi:hypothetical protein
MINHQPQAHPRPLHSAADRAAADLRRARAQRDLVIASLLRCPAPDEPT